MKYGLYSVRDSKLETYATPFTQANNNVAMRSFGDVANDPQTSIYKHPSDFSLIRLGTWDEDSGIVENEDHTTLAWALDFQNEETSS